MAAYDFEIIIGTYEEFLLGYLCSVKDKEVKQSFASHDHSSSIRTIDHCGQYVASGGADDRIIIYDFNTRKECHMLVHHVATVNCLSFTDKHTHLISGSSDGVLAIIRVGNWQIEKKWDKAHKGLAIYDVAIHPSGKLALTIGADSTLRTWNLVKGRQAYAINLMTKSKDAKSLEKIVWSPEGTYFILYGGKHTEIWNIEEGGLFKSIDYDKKVTSCIWLKSDKILVGHENGDLTIVKLDDCSKASIQGHDSRIKSLGKFGKWIVSISSNGEFKIWNSKLKEILKENTGCRPTCLSIIPTLKVKEEESSDEEIKEEPEIFNVNKRAKIIIEEDDDVKNEEVVPKKKKKNRKKSKIPVD
ncbi:p21-activated protein kinase-interacting protein 1-like [Coccinella septempunctata]|uniref:p21-activated protein kinase-interacting protein 1-like n=1 Tax=Coccinella septempunctata TaxID=41139 RepID=UPI001D0876E9|nr:p21-activated protein kinase-interacting protein 1-like [Coccinella septempunctata]